MSFDPHAAAERIRFRLGPLEGHVRVLYDAETDNCIVRATLRTRERDTGEPGAACRCNDRRHPGFHRLGGALLLLPQAGSSGEARRPACRAGREAGRQGEAVTARCPRCDREGCPTLRPFCHRDYCEDADPPQNFAACPGCAAEDDCRAHAVDWRARALTAEVEVERLTACLAKSNAGFEEHERKWYLATGRAEDAEAEVERLRARVDRACDVASEAWSYLPDDHDARDDLAAEVNAIAGAKLKKEPDQAEALGKALIDAAADARKPRSEP